MQCSEHQIIYELNTMLHLMRMWLHVILQWRNSLQYRVSKDSHIQCTWCTSFMNYILHMILPMLHSIQMWVMWFYNKHNYTLFMNYISNLDIVHICDNQKNKKSATTSFALYWSKISKLQTNFKCNRANIAFRVNAVLLMADNLTIWFTFVVQTTKPILGVG